MRNLLKLTFISVAIASSLYGGDVATANDSAPEFIPSIECASMSLPSGGGDVPTITMSGCTDPATPAPQIDTTPSPIVSEVVNPVITATPDPISKPTETGINLDTTGDGAITDITIDDIIINVYEETQADSGTTAPKEESVVINKIETFEVIESYDTKSLANGSKESTITLTNNTTGEKREIKVVSEIEDSSTTSNLNGVITQAKIIGNRGEEITLVAQINNNGTKIAQVVTKNSNGKESKAQLASEDTTGDVSLKKDGSLEIVKSKTLESGEMEESRVIAKKDGSVSHEIKRTDVSGNEVVTKATSKAPNSSVVVKKDGTVQTSVKVTNNRDNSKVDIVVEAKLDGKAVHILKVKDSQGNEVVTKATSEFPGALTTIGEDGTVQTAVKPQANTEVKAKANLDGTSSHEVAITKEDGTQVASKATSKISGAQTVVGTTGEVTTTAKVTKTDDNGAQFEIRAIAITKDNGITSTRFERVNITTGETEELNPTVNKDTPFEEGNVVEVEEDAVNGLQIRINTKVTKELVIE